MKLCGFDVGLDQPFFLMAGPCVIESEEMVMEIAREMNVTVANVKRLNGIAIERLRHMLGPLFALVLPLLPPLHP